MFKRAISTAALALAVIFVAPTARADAIISDWIGEYAMNHDGHHGTLRIRDTKADCASSAWCELVLDYIDSSGNRISGTINTVDQRGQHMWFTLAFPNNNQVFNGWIFSWEKNYMAGTTVWGGRTFGFFAGKSAQTGSTGALHGRIGADEPVRRPS